MSGGFLDSPSRWSPRRWGRRPLLWLFRWLYVLGVCGGFGSSQDGRGNAWISWPRWQGGRPYVLGWPSTKWGCLLRRHHWPRWFGGEPLAFGFCARCLPWPCCGSIERGHAPDCAEPPL